MKALLMVTGRGMGGDAVTALNISKALTKKGVKCEFVLDRSAPGILLEKNGIKWHKIRIPQAGGHAATKLKLTKAGLKTSIAAMEAVKVIRKSKADVVVGVIGGGAIIGCISAKIARVPGVGVLNTPTDTRVCTRLNASIILPESNIFSQDSLPENLYKCYGPVNPDIIAGNKEEALKKMPESFDPTKNTIIFSSGSSLFEMMAQAAKNISLGEIDANILVVGHPLKEEFLNLFQNTNIIYLGYVDWVNDLLNLADVAVLSDDGVMIHEAIACKVPIVALNGVKYGRYHNMSRIFPGALMESSLENLQDTLKEALSHIGAMKKQAQKYGDDVLHSADKIADIVMEEAKKGRRK
ncbi:glycosyltransferase [Methanobacterium alkalithermotolerans]|uniref:Glycosyltransferase n=1 Tax=Methanobacterium alkalithermotolerans TaxID=2731220 RepID=A0A8T8K6V8_9EURY|nr:glycosyltransferase [Methanobacterium alkalithermotolerans]QUH23639.1 glycosyltransferase [Methanobacterium alkalithermotolerans]